MSCTVDGVFRSKLGVFLMQEWGPHEKTKKRATEEIFNGSGEHLSGL